MNCQKGDLAIVVDEPGCGDGVSRNSGKIVRCLELLPGFKFRGRQPCDVWKTDTVFYAADEQRHNLMPDYRLKPIRDPGDDAVDETIQRLGTPMEMRLRELENELAKLNSSLDRLEKVLTR